MEVGEDLNCWSATNNGAAEVGEDLKKILGCEQQNIYQQLFGLYVTTPPQKIPATKPSAWYSLTSRSF